MAETHQFLVPPMNSGRLNVGLATTAPELKMSDCYSVEISMNEPVGS